MLDLLKYKELPLPLQCCAKCEKTVSGSGGQVSPRKLATNIE